MTAPPVTICPPDRARFSLYWHDVRRNRAERADLRQTRGRYNRDETITPRNYTDGPERRLWIEVLYRALEDACWPGAGRDWILSNCRDFQFVCELAGFNPVAVRDAFAADPAGLNARICRLNNATYRRFFR